MSALEIEAPTSATVLLPLTSIVPSPTNPRQHYDGDKLQELAASIRKHGVIQPILVRPIDGRYELIAGERRFRASEIAGIDSIPAIIRELDDKATLEIQVIENLQREDLSPIEEAEGYERLIRDHGYEVDDLAAKIGKSRSYVYGRMKLTALCDEARRALWDGQINHSLGLLIARIPDPKLQVKALQEIVGDDFNAAMSFRAAADYIQREFMLRISNAPWALDDEGLVPAAGPCTTCPMRTGNQSELFADVGSADLCTSPVCWKEKLEAFWKLRQAEAKENGDRVLSSKESKEIFDKYSSRGLRWGAPFVRVDEHCEDDPKRRTYQKLLGKKLPQLVVAMNPHDGKIYELLDRSAATAAVHKAHPETKKPSRLVDHGERARETAEYIKQQKERELEQHVHRAALVDLINAVESRTADLLEAGGLRLIVETRLLESAEYDVEDVEIIMKRRDWLIAPDGLEDEAIHRFVESLKGEQLFGVLVEITFQVASDRSKNLDRLRMEMFELAGVDLKEVKKRVRAEVKSAEKDAKKASPKKGKAGVCSSCGCTEDNACETDVGPCGWVNDEQTLCSACGGRNE